MESWKKQCNLCHSHKKYNPTCSLLLWHEDHTSIFPQHSFIHSFIHSSVKCQRLISEAVGGLMEWRRRRRNTAIGGPSEEKALQVFTNSSKQQRVGSRWMEVLIWQLLDRPSRWLHRSSRPCWGMGVYSSDDCTYNCEWRAWNCT